MLSMRGRWWNRCARSSISQRRKNEASLKVAGSCDARLAWTERLWPALVAALRSSVLRLARSPIISTTECRLHKPFRGGHATHARPAWCSAPAVGHFGGILCLAHPSCSQKCPQRAGCQQTSSAFGGRQSKISPMERGNPGCSRTSRDEVVVLRAGIEPAHLSAADFKSAVSTSFTIGAAQPDIMP